jgi:CheY-like chemotaxis protein
MRDETERQQLQERMIEAQKLEALGCLVGGVAHDYNNCFAGILGHVSLLKQVLVAGTEASEYAAAIEQSARRAADITSKLLSFARRQAEDREPVIVSFLVEETLALAAETFPKGLVVQTDLSTDLPPVTVSPGRMQQAVLNVLLAARDAMPQGGTLTVATRRVTDFQSPGSLTPAAAVAISITYTRKPPAAAGKPGPLELFIALEGAGEDSLGLAAAHGILHAHGGMIDIAAGAPGSATFTIYIPTGGEKEAAGGAAQAAAGEGPLVLLVEDDPVLGRLAADILVRNGYTVETATAGTAIESAGRLGARVKAVLVDVKDMTTIGREIVEIIREQIAEVPVVVCASQQEDKGASWVLSLPRATLLVKPFSSNDLLATMSRAVAGGGRNTT